ncbi:MAG: ABC transporter permease subunit [Endomicrobia bacterium]|nr:ABC transporter permease subunit [Endomicrobiia bacterium]
MNKDKIFVIAKKELQLYFNSPIAYIVLFIFLVISGFFFGRPLFVQNYSTMRHYFDVLPLFLLFFIPAITMKIYSEDYKTGTIELMYTLPYSKVEILLGKYVAALIVSLIGVGLTLFYPLILIFLGKPDIGMIISGYLGIVLLCMFFTSIGVFSSSLTKNQIVSFIVAFFISFIFFILGKIGLFLPQWLSYVGIDFHYDNFVRGVLDVRDIIFFASLICLFLYFTLLSSENKAK